MKPLDIINSLKSHQLALDYGDQYRSLLCISHDSGTSRRYQISTFTDGKEKMGHKTKLLYSLLATVILQGLITLSFEIIGE